MTRRLYTIPIAARASDITTDQIRQGVSEEGLLERDTAAVDQIALDDATHRVTGRFDWGPLLSTRAGREIQSLGESSFGAVPLFGDDLDERVSGPGYYQVGDSEAAPAFEGFDSVWEYDVSLTKVGTQETEWRAVRTKRQDANNPQDLSFVDPELNIDADPELYLDAEASKVAWFSPRDGKEPATPVDTVETEFSTVAKYDAENTTIDDPELLYELPFDREGRADVVLWDDRDRVKTQSFGGKDVTVWEHVFHTGWQREGSFVVSNGRFRVRFNEAAGEIEAEEWSAADGWEDRTVSDEGWGLVDATPESINAAAVTLYVEFSDGDETVPLHATLERGVARVLWREPEGVSTPESLQDQLESVSILWDETLTPTQTTRSRSEVESP